jgi:hypothetical protein
VIPVLTMRARRQGGLAEAEALPAVEVAQVMLAAQTLGPAMLARQMVGGPQKTTPVSPMQAPPTPEWSMVGRVTS